MGMWAASQEKSIIIPKKNLSPSQRLKIATTQRGLCGWEGKKDYNYWLLGMLMGNFKSKILFLKHPLVSITKPFKSLVFVFWLSVNYFLNILKTPRKQYQLSKSSGSWNTVISYPHGTSIFSDSSPWVFGCSNKENLFNNQDMSSLIIISFFCGFYV